MLDTRRSALYIGNYEKIQCFTVGFGVFDGSVGYSNADFSIDIFDSGSVIFKVGENDFLG